MLERGSRRANRSPSFVPQDFPTSRLGDKCSESCVIVLSTDASARSLALRLRDSWASSMKIRPEEESELAFEACLKARGFDEPEHQPRVGDKTKRLDFRVYVGDTPLFFEVKEFKKEKEFEEGI